MRRAIREKREFRPKERKIEISRFDRRRHCLRFKKGNDCCSIVPPSGASYFVEFGVQELLKSRTRTTNPRMVQLDLKSLKFH